MKTHIKAFQELKVDDDVIEYDDAVAPGYGKGKVSMIFDAGGFLVKFPDRKLLVMFVGNGVRYDKESKKGSRRIRTIEEDAVHNTYDGDGLFDGQIPAKIA